MSERHLFDKQPGAATYMHVTDDGVVLEKVFDREPVLEYAGAMRNEVQQTGELRKVMSVPIPLIYQWVREGKLGAEAFQHGRICIDRATLQKLFADPDFAGLRTVDKL